jgi:branched-chain amino acid transport system substrate-binding protein
MQLHNAVSRRVSVIALVIGAAVLSPVARAADPIEIPAMLPMTGAAAFLGRSEADSLRALEAAVNKRGGMNGHDMHFAIVDNAGNPQIGVQLLNAALAKKPLAVIDGGPLSTCRAGAAIVAGAGPVLYCFSPSIHPTAGSYVFSGLNSSHDILGVSLKYLRERGLKKIAVINATDATGQDADDVIGVLMKSPDNVRAGVTIAAYEHFNLADLSVSAQMARIKAAGPQAIIAFVSGTPIATVLHAVQDSGLGDIPIVTSTANGTYEQMESLKSIMPKELLFAGPPLLVPNDVTDPAVKRAIGAFNDAFAVARGDLVHGVAWDVASVVITGLQQRRSDSPAALRDTIAAMRDYSGVLGKYNFRDAPQRGLTTDSLIMERWVPESDGWVAVSKPGGSLK